MRAIVASDFGGVERLHVEHVDSPAPGPGRVRVRVAAAAVNPSDVKRLQGAFGTSGTTPFRLGSEVSGTVTALGEGVAGIAVGDAVIAFRVSGGFAEEVVAREADVFAKPESLGWSEAAGLLLTGTTAYHCLEATGVGEGDRVLLHGAAGAVGVAVVQLALARGATVLGTASERNFDVVRSLGATPVAYGDALIERARPFAPTVAIDAVGTDEAIDVSLALVEEPGRIATISAFERAAGTGIRMLGGGAGADPGTELRNGARGDLVRLAGAGGLRVLVGRELPLESAAEAFELVASGHAGGKVVLVP
jgi:NADPH:quinone reductase-like Zn-dependent oxidoreductase